MTTKILQAVFGLAAVGWPLFVGAADEPAFDAKNQLQRPTDFREWVFLTTGFDMFYGPDARKDGPSTFTNVFAKPEAYKAFKRTGQWPDKTVLMIEARRAEKGVSIDNNGQSQGAIVAIEAEVKDLKRFPATNGWAYFSFYSQNGLKDSAEPHANDVCYDCHAANTAVDNTFVQFYPTLFSIARQMKTVKPTYDPAHKP